MITTPIELNLAGLTYSLLFGKIFVCRLLGDGCVILFCGNFFEILWKKTEENFAQPVFLVSNVLFQQNLITFAESILFKITHSPVPKGWRQGFKKY
jgi:hypothetical protein